MKNRDLISFVPGETPLHKLTGTSKVRLFLLMLCFITIVYDARLIMPCFFICIYALLSLKPSWQKIKGVVLFVVFINFFTQVFYWFVEPGIGVRYCGGEPFELFRLSAKLIFTRQDLWYIVVRYFKFTADFLICLIFIQSITPSEFASGLYSCFVPYKICSIVELALRYIPDITRDYNNIATSMQCRGVEMDARKVSVMERAKQMILILVPLLITSFDRIGNIANAMDLRGYGKLKKRSYYCEHEPAKRDKICNLIIIAVLVFDIVYIVTDIIHPRVPVFWYPF